MPKAAQAEVLKREQRAVWADTGGQPLLDYPDQTVESLDGFVLGRQLNSGVVVAEAL
ncbi:hypothetical protein ACH4TV_10810 [Streptomyces sp. NPDC020898]|uniref:hypothetical protein n=1 Tax=Streptomyces sp. NPDC020898 TaxID=3365101 RepID=UPI0037BBA637